MNTRRDLTEAEKIAAANLKKIWNERKHSLGIDTQAKLAVLMGFSGQAVVSQYMNGKIPLNADAGMKFAHHLRVFPSSINPEWAMYDHPSWDKGGEKKHSQEAESLLTIIDELDPDEREAFKKLLAMKKKA